MKRILKVCLFVLCLIPFKVKALSGNINMECNSYKAVGNDEITCNITAYADDEVTGLSANIVLSDNLEMISFVTDSAWQGDASGNKIGLYTEVNKKDTFNVGVLKVRVKSSANEGTEAIILNNVIYADSEFNKVSISSVSKDIKISSLNNYLKSLSINPGSINFNKNTLTYDVTLDSSVIEITCEKEEENATINGDIGSKNLSYGKNTFKINVVSESNEVRTYILNVTRIDNRNTENRLSSIGVNGKNINFNEDKFEYNISVEYDVTTAKITGSLKDSSSSFVNGYGPRTINLNEGNNKVELRVISENGITRTYTININRKEDPNNKSDDNYLKDIDIKDNDIDFDKDKKEYRITVDYNTDKLDIDTVISSNKSKVEIIGNENFKVGENVVIIKVTAKDNSVREYKIIVTKKAKEEILDSNSYLKNITIEGYNINFNKNTYNYTLNIKDEESLKINAISESNLAKVKIVGNSNLNNNNVIKIIVTAEDKTTSTYTITVNKGKEINYLLITVIVETIVIIGIILFLVLRKKKSDVNEEV